MSTVAPTQRVRRQINSETSGFTLLELLVAVALLTVIVVSIYHVFNYIQQALRANINQVDALESSRAALETLRTDFGMLTSCPQPEGTNLHIYHSSEVAPTTIALSSGAKYTNWFYSVYFLRAIRDRYEAVSYRVSPIKAGVGVLMRYSTNVTRIADFVYLSRLLETLPSHSFVPLLDGVVHFRLAAYDTEEVPLLYSIPEVRQASENIGGLTIQPFVYANSVFPSETELSTRDNVLPGSIEIELGVLERSALEYYIHLPTGSYGESRFLPEHAGQIYLFRQRVRIPRGNLKIFSQGDEGS